MKRWIALLLLASLCLLAACNENTTTSESVSSSDGSTGLSETSDDTSQPTDTPVRDDALAAVISMGKPYTNTTEAGESYPDSYGMELTDGRLAPAASADYNDANYAGYNFRGTFHITLDLGEVSDRIYEFRLGYLATANAGIKPPSSVMISVSEDGENFEQVGSMTLPEYVEGCRQEAVLMSESYLTARYVRFAVAKEGGWVFLDEMTVIADEEDGGGVDGAFLEMIKQTYDALGTVSYEGGAVPDETLAKLLVSQKCTYTVSASAAEGFADSDSYLTDGNAGGIYETGNWVGYSGGNAVTITVDLQSVRNDLLEFRLTCYSNNATGNYMPAAVTYAVSDDNETFTDIGRIYGVASGQSVYDFPLVLEKCATGRYVRFTMEATDTRMYLVEEAAVYARTGTSGVGSLYPPLAFDAPSGEWENPSSETVNLLLGLPQQVYIPMDIEGVNMDHFSPVDTPVLTDGKKATANEIHNGQFFKMMSEAAPVEIYYDLGATGAVKTFTAQFTHRMSWGVQAPYSVTVYLSSDGKTWYNAGSMAVEPQNDNTLVEASFSMDAAVQTRYVCFAFMTCNWCGIGELEAFGTTSVSGAKTLEDSGLLDREETALGYQAPEESVLNGASDLCLLYHGTQVEGYTVEKLLPYLAYVEEDGTIKDTMFDSFLFLMSGNFPSGVAAASDHTMNDLEWTITDLFTEGENILALEEAAGMVKEALSLGDDFKYGFTVTLYKPNLERTDFGDLDGDGKTDGVTSEADRLRALEWYMEAFEAELAKYTFENIEFVGYYWYSEGIYPENDEPELVTETSELVHGRGYDFFWIPWYCASGFDSWKSYGFDITCMQPNYVFNEEVPYGRIEQAAYMTRFYGMGIEIEIASTSFQNEALYNRYLEYLAGGAKYGYMKDCVHMYYQEIFVYYNAAVSGDPKVRALYDYTYQFIKGTLNANPEALETLTVSGTKDTPLTAAVMEDAPEMIEFEVVTAPAHGTVSIGSDGSFTYYPEKGFAGSVSFTYTYNEGLGESEVCTVNITIE